LPYVYLFCDSSATQTEEKIFILIFFGIIKMKKCLICRILYSPICGRSFHKFPSNTESRKKWLEALQLSTVPNFNTSYICSDHFEETCFYDCETLKKIPKLRPEAVPSITCNSFMHKKIKLSASTTQVLIENDVQREINKGSNGIVEAATADSFNNYSEEIGKNVCKGTAGIDTNDTSSKDFSFENVQENLSSSSYNRPVYTGSSESTEDCSTISSTCSLNFSSQYSEQSDNIPCNMSQMTFNTSNEHCESNYQVQAMPTLLSITKNKSRNDVIDGNMKKRKKKIVGSQCCTKSEIS